MSSEGTILDNSSGSHTSGCSKVSMLMFVLFSLVNIILIGLILSATITSTTVDTTQWTLYAVGSVLSLFTWFVFYKGMSVDITSITVLIFLLSEGTLWASIIYSQSKGFLLQDNISKAGSHILQIMYIIMSIICIHYSR